MSEPFFEISKSAGFDAAHSLPDSATADHRCLHGHSFQVEATVGGALDPARGWVADLGALEAALRTLAAALDHSHLNATPGLETPTLEHLCLHFARHLRPQFEGLRRIAVSRPTVGERCVLELADEDGQGMISPGR